MASVTDYAELCKASYSGQNQTSYARAYTAHSDSTGFDGNIYVNGNDVVVVYAASTEEDHSNLEQILYGNIGVPFVDTMPAQLQDAVDLYKKAKELYPTANISIAGHSFGGALAQLVGYITSEKTVTFASPGMAYAQPQLTVDYVENTLGLQDEYTWLNASQITNYSNMNDPVGSIGTRLGTTLWYVPQPINQNENSYASPHENIDLFFDSDVINNCQQLANWDFRHSVALWIYDKNFTEDNFLTEAMKFRYNINEDTLIEAINIIENNPNILNNLTEPLDYKIPNVGDILIGTDGSVSLTGENLDDLAELATPLLNNETELSIIAPNGTYNITPDGNFGPPDINGERTLKPGTDINKIRHYTSAEILTKGGYFYDVNRDLHTIYRVEYADGTYDEYNMINGSTVWGAIQNGYNIKPDLKLAA